MKINIEEIEKCTNNSLAIETNVSMLKTTHLKALCKLARAAKDQVGKPQSGPYGVALKKALSQFDFETNEADNESK